MTIYHVSAGDSLIDLKIFETGECHLVSHYKDYIQKAIEYGLRGFILYFLLQDEDDIEIAEHFVDQL